MLSGRGALLPEDSKSSKFFALVAGTMTEALDAENQLLLGGDNGLRGYPLRYQAGTSRALLTLEQRYYTGWYPFHLFHVGAAAFFDMGRTWGTDVTGADSLGLLKDVGIGLRFGSSRSSFGNVIHVDLAFPLDGDTRSTACSSSSRRKRSSDVLPRDASTPAGGRPCDPLPWRLRGSPSVARTAPPGRSLEGWTRRVSAGCAEHTDIRESASGLG